MLAAEGAHGRRAVAPRLGQGGAGGGEKVLPGGGIRQPRTAAEADRRRDIDGRARRSTTGSSSAIAGGRPSAACARDQMPERGAEADGEAVVTRWPATVIAAAQQRRASAQASGLRADRGSRVAEAFLAASSRTRPSPAECRPVRRDVRHAPERARRSAMKAAPSSSCQVGQPCQHRLAGREGRSRREGAKAQRVRPAPARISNRSPPSQNPRGATAGRNASTCGPASDLRSRSRAVS